MRYQVDRDRTEKSCSRCKRVLPLTEFGKAAKQWDGLNTYCKDCLRTISDESYQKRRKKQAEKRALLKTQYVNQLGGKCVRCGYNEFVSALDFHHVDSDEKEHGIAVLFTKALYGNGKQTTALKKEILKCVLLCRNCHMALHSGEWSAETRS